MKSSMHLNSCINNSSEVCSFDSAVVLNLHSNFSVISPLQPIGVIISQKGRPKKTTSKLYLMVGSILQSDY